MIELSCFARARLRLRDDNHLSLMRHLLRLIGSRDRVPRAMFPYPWPSRLGTAIQVLFAICFLPRSVLARREAVIIHGRGTNLLQGELLVSDTGVAAKSFACARLRLPFLVVRSVERRPVARVVAILGIDPEEDLHVYMSLNALIIFFARERGRSVVVHLATSPAGEDAIERHRRGLLLAREAAKHVSAREFIAEMISCADREGYRVLVQSRLPGSSLRLHHEPEAALHAAIDRALDALLRLRIAGSGEQGADADLIFNRFPRLAGYWPELRGLLEPLVARLQQWQRRRRLPSVLTHGDYWIRNVLFDETGREVTGIVDWERCRLNGTPGLDALHLALMSLAMEQGRDVAGMLEQAWTRQWESVFLASYVARVEAEYGLDADDTAHLAAFLYCDELEKLLAAGSEVPRRRLTRLLGVRTAIKAWLEQSP
jgi:aminoglycoside phosphotransferase